MSEFSCAHRHQEVANVDAMAADDAELEVLLDVHDENAELEALLDVHNGDFVRPIIDIHSFAIMVTDFENMDKVIMGWLIRIRLCDETKPMIQTIEKPHVHCNIVDWFGR